MSPPAARRANTAVRSTKGSSDPAGRPKRDYRSAQHEGAPVSPPGRPKGETRSAQHEGTPASESTPPVIHLVDDDASLRTALGRLLVLAGYEVRHYRSAGDYLLAEPDDAPGCLLLDVQMPGPSGLELQAALQRRGHRLPVVFLTGHGDIPSTVRAIKAGASDFLCKPVERQTLLAAIESALALGAGRGADCAAEASTGAGTLTARETAVLRAVVQGRLNKQIGADLGLSERTIKSCRAELMRKLGARSLADLVRLAPRWLAP